MASAAQEPEVALAQRLAANETSVRRKALKTLRKYISLRSQKMAGGFTSDDLMKIWKGLFYSLWMQDKPGLQEELSDQISGLIHSFQKTDDQFLYFETFLQTVKREWNGIDRLRMDKFFQLVRFVFKQAFEVLKRKEWESSLTSRFLALFTAQLLQSSKRVPDGLLLHILELYMTELARVGSAELTAEQSLTFIHPFCKTLAETKDHSMLVYISKHIFSTILDHAPYAVEDLMKEMNNVEDSDSGQSSEEEEESGEESEPRSKTLKKAKGMKINGISKKENGDEDSEDELLSLEDVDSEEDASDDDVGPVLQFDYGAIADHLFKLGSRPKTPSFNRTKIYKLVKIFNNLSEGVFPQEDDYDNSVKPKHHLSKKSKKKRRNEDQADDENSATKKRKVPVDAVQKLCELNQNQEQSSENIKKKKKLSKTDFWTSTETSKATLETPVSLRNSESPTKKKEEEELAIIVDTESQSKLQDDKDLQSVVEPSARKKRKSKKLNLQGIGGDEAAKCEVYSKGETMEEVDSGTQLTTPQTSGRKKSKIIAVEMLSPDNCASETPVNIPDMKDISASTSAKNKKRKKKSSTEVISISDSAGQIEAMAACTMETPIITKTQKKQKKQMANLFKEVVEESQPADSTEEAMPQENSKKNTEAKAETPVTGATPLKKAKKKRKRQADKAQTSQINGQTVKEDLESSTLLTPKKKKKKASSESDFASFQGQTKAPTPLFCKVKRKGSPSTPLSSLKTSLTPKSDTKKVTFGLKNNKTTEFRKMDQSLLVSPVGESRVAFDPKKKPTSSVLKSPLSSSSISMKKSAPKKRPTAADFF